MDKIEKEKIRNYKNIKMNKNEETGKNWKKNVLTKKLGKNVLTKKLKNGRLKNEFIIRENAM